MKKLALVIALALEIAVCACGTSPNTNPVNNTSTTGNWEAQLTGGTEQASLLNFVVAFSVENSGPLDVTGFGFFNQGSCFANGLNAETVSGTANFTTSGAETVTGTLNLTINSSTNNSALKLSGNLTGTSNATSTTVGTLTNGVVVGTWTLTPGANLAGCNSDSGSFVMCQGAATCSTVSTAARRRDF